MSNQPVNSKSGPHPSLDPQSGEVREVQFEVQRECNCDVDWRQFIEEAAPFPIWVRWPGRSPKGLPPTNFCNTKIVYEVASGPTPFTGAPAMSRKQQVVCEHMGRLIE